MAQATQRYKRTLNGSIGAGMKSVFGSDRRYYILEHKVSSKYHKAGEAQEIIVDQIEIGRSHTCQVRFDDAFKTVSRKHAAIVKDGDNWKIIPMSETNSTFLNGQKLNKEWYLQSGDEIQLAVNGPKLGFIIPSGKKATVGSIGLTRRMSLFRQQALRPYKTAIASLAAVLVLAVGGLGTWNYILHDDLKNQSYKLAEQIKKNKDNKEIVDSLAQKLAEANEKIAAADEKIKNVKTKTVVIHVPTPSPPSDINNESVTNCYPYTYLVKCCMIDANGKQIICVNENGDEVPVGWSGTGFLLENGYFVTAHHMIHYDDFDFDGEEINPNGAQTIINSRYYSGQWGILMTAVSSSGDKIEIKYSYVNNPFRTGNTKTASEQITDDAGRSWIVRTHFYGDGSDWACVKVNKTGGLPYDSPFSMNMPPQTKLTILGFPSGMDKTQNGKISPDVSEAITSRQGLEDGGWIRTSNENTDHGNSGGPVVTIRNNKPTVIGLCSGANQGSDKTHRKGRIVPIGAVFN